MQGPRPPRRSQQVRRREWAGLSTNRSTVRDREGSPRRADRPGGAEGALYVLAQARVSDPDEGWLDIERLAHRTGFGRKVLDVYLSRAREALVLARGRRRGTDHRGAKGWQAPGGARRPATGAGSDSGGRPGSDLDGRQQAGGAIPSPQTACRGARCSSGDSRSVGSVEAYVASLNALVAAGRTDEALSRVPQESDGVSAATRRGFKLGGDGRFGVTGDVWHARWRQDWPVALVDWWDATAFAARASRRLPHDHEWEKAARGVDGRPYAWATTSMPLGPTCRTADRPPPSPARWTGSTRACTGCAASLATCATGAADRPQA
ncbi:MAG: SUMF1/EgtB/PvdO family nonheme iron enzyme, partial [Myxococcota bacterium]